MYFLNSPPFENTKDKKNEFPDAIALLSLESWAIANKTKVVVVSNDAGWERYCNQSSHLLFLNDLDDALSKFITHGKLKEIIKYIQEENIIIKSEYFLAHIQDRILEAIENSDPEIFARVSTKGMCEVLTLKYLDHRYIEDGNQKLLIKIVKVLEKSIVLKIKAIVNYEVGVKFKFRVQEKSERLSIYLDDEPYISQEEFTAEILLHLEGNFNEVISGAVITNIEVLNEVEMIDLGFVGPDLYEIFDREGVLMR
jgi:hypothetical protein